MGIYFNGEGTKIGNRPESKKWSIYKIVGRHVSCRRAGVWCDSEVAVDRRGKERYIKVFGVCTNNKESHNNIIQTTKRSAFAIGWRLC